MRKVNTKDVPEDAWASPKGKYRGFGRSVSVALGRNNDSTDLMERHPFDVEILRVEPGCTPYVYHSHGTQWEFYHVISGKGVVRDVDGMTSVEAGDAFLFKPGEAHQITNDGSEDLVVYVIADNPLAESTHYPDSAKWVVRSPHRAFVRAEPVDYFEGEE